MCAAAFDAQFGDDRRNSATLGDALFGLGGSERCFDDFDGSGSGIVFGTQCDDRAAAVQNIANQLKRGGAHQAVRVDAQRDVVDSFAAVDRFGNHQLLVLGPGKLRGDLVLGAFFSGLQLARCQE